MLVSMHHTPNALAVGTLKVTKYIAVNKTVPGKNKQANKIIFNLSPSAKGLDWITQGSFLDNYP